MITGNQSLFGDIPEPLLNVAEEYYRKYQIKYKGVEDPISSPPEKDRTTYEQVAIDRIEVADNTSFGSEHLCLQALGKLKMRSFLSKLGLAGDDVDRALTSVAARAIYRASEYKTADILRTGSSLKECLGYQEDITHKQLCRIAYILLHIKQEIDQYLHERLTDMFDLKDSLVIFDISNTYFESRKTGSELAPWGRSNQKRTDCPIVIFTGVISAEGFIRHSRIYQGPRRGRPLGYDLGPASLQRRRQENHRDRCGNSHRPET